MKATIVFLLYAASNVKNSPTKPEVPGKPIEPNVNIKKKLIILEVLNLTPQNKQFA